MRSPTSVHLTAIRFPYRRLGGVFQPLIPIGVKLESWYAVDVYVDSGAYCTVLQSAIADRADFNYRTGQRIALI